MTSILISAKRAMDLKGAPKPRIRAIMKIVLRYLVGLETYAKTRKALSKFKVHMQFSKWLKKLSMEEQHYIHDNLRSATRVARSWFAPRKKIASYDLKAIDGCRLPYRKVQVGMEIPTELECIKSYTPTIRKAANSAYHSIKSYTTDGSFDFQDVHSELLMKLVQTYRLYVYSFGNDKFNLKIFYSCLHNAVRNQVKDILKRFNNFKRKMNSVAYSMDSIIEDTGGHMFQHQESPEAIYMAKEAFFKNPFASNKLLRECNIPLELSQQY